MDDGPQLGIVILLDMEHDSQDCKGVVIRVSIGVGRIQCMANIVAKTPIEMDNVSLQWIMFLRKQSAESVLPLSFSGMPLPLQWCAQIPPHCAFPSENGYWPFQSC